MTRPDPSAVIARLADATGDEYDEPIWVKRKDHWRLNGRKTVAYAAVSETGRAVVRKEIGLYEWGAANEIPVPPLVAHDGSGAFIAFEKIPVDPPHGSTYVRLGIDAIDRFNSASRPPGFLVEDRPRRGPRARSAPIRRIRMRRASLDPREIRDVRSRFGRLDADVLAHGDFHTGNFLFDASRGRAHVIDLEYMGLSPALIDLATFWATLERPDDRDLVLEGMRARLPAGGEEHMGLVLHHAILRFLEEVTTWSPRKDWNQHRVAQGFVALETARALDAGWER